MKDIDAASRLSQASRGKLPGMTYLLALCQAINLTAAVVSVTIAALAGDMLAPNHAWATVPYGVQFAAVTVFTYPAASFMRRHGRKKAFLLGAMFLIAAGVIGYDATTRHGSLQLIAAHGMLGIYVAFANFYRFAAVDGLAQPMRTKAVSLVVAGGLVAAISGPLLSIGLKDVGGFATFSLCYASFVLLGLITIALLVFWRPIDSPPTAIQSVDSPNVATSRIAPAIVASASSYLIMNLLMVQASLLMESMCVSFNASSLAIQGHVIAMFAPSFVTGAILVRVGHRNCLLAGYLLLACAAALGILAVSLWAMVAGLILLGVGWNFGYVGGGALLACTVTDRNRHRTQGINDSIIAICATAGAFLPAVLQTLIGWRNTNLLCLALCAIAGAFTWVCMREAPARNAEALPS